MQPRYAVGILQALEKGWVGNGTGPQIGDPDAEEVAAPEADLKKTSPNQRYMLGLLPHDVEPVTLGPRKAAALSCSQDVPLTVTDVLFLVARALFRAADSKLMLTGQVSCCRFGGLEGIIRTFTGDGPEGMTGHGKHPNGAPYISCRAGGAEDDRARARGANGARRGRSGAKASCMGCNVM